MARLVRVVPPGHPHLITQRGNFEQAEDPGAQVDEEKAWPEAGRGVTPSN